MLTVTTPVRPRPTAAAGPAGALDELGRLEQLVEVGAADDAGGVEGGIGDARFAGERARVGDRGRLRLVASTDLDGHDRLAELERAIGQGEEALRPLEPLEEQDDRGRLGVVEAVREVVAHVEHDLGAAADDPREPDPGARLDERIGDRTRLGDAGDAAARQVGRHVADVGRRVDGQVHDAHAVGADQRDPVLPGDGRDLALHLGGGFPTLDDPAAGDDHGRDAGGGGVTGDDRGTERVERDDGDIGALREGVERRVAGLAMQLVVARVDEVAAGRAAGHAQVVADGLRDPTPWRGADDRDRARGEQRPQVDGPGRRGRGGELGHPTTRSTPRFSSARAMISRWISDVPSQIRSTRSSRKNRSAGNSRM